MGVECWHSKDHFLIFIWRSSLNEQKKSIEDAILRMRLRIVVQQQESVPIILSISTPSQTTGSNGLPSLS